MGPAHTNAASPLLHREVPAQTPLALLAQELRRQPMFTGPIDHFKPTSLRHNPLSFRISSESVVPGQD
jgi:hypothetical protein